MENPHQPPEERYALESLLVQAKYFVRSLMADLEAFLPSGEAILPAAQIQLLMQRWLLPAEAALRRMILLIATTLVLDPRPIPAREGRSPVTGGEKPPVSAPLTPRLPAFNMQEPQPRQKAGKPTEGPRAVRTEAAPINSPAPTAPTEKFLNRLDALAAAMGNPARVAERWLRRQHRLAQERRETGPRLCFDTVPGLHKTLGDEGLGLMHRLNAAARAAYPPRADTS